MVATGAARFDSWFAQQPSTEREEFLTKVGLDPTKRFLLYLCSSVFVAPEERTFFDRWLSALHLRFGDIGVIVRPHPKRAEPWADVELSGNAVVWPRRTGELDPESRAGFYDSIFHSAGVVGVNTSAMIEAAIAGKSVYTVLAPEFNQGQTIHFHYLLAEHGGFLHVAGSLDEHFEQLTAGLANEEAESDGRAGSSPRSSAPAASTGARPRSTPRQSKSWPRSLRPRRAARRGRYGPPHALAALSSAALAAASARRRSPAGCRGTGSASGKTRVGTVRA